MMKNLANHLVAERRDKALRWLCGGEVGLSSKAMMTHFEGLPNDDPTFHPLDPADFRRCCLLLDAIPEYRARLDELRALSPVWDRLVDRWDEFEALLRFDTKTGLSPELRSRMQKLIKGTPLKTAEAVR